GARPRPRPPRRGRGGWRPRGATLPRRGRRGGGELEERDLRRAAEADPRAREAETAAHVEDGAARAVHPAVIAGEEAPRVPAAAEARQRDLAAVEVAGEDEREAERRRLGERVGTVQHQAHGPVAGQPRSGAGA